MHSQLVFLWDHVIPSFALFWGTWIGFFPYSELVDSENDLNHTRETKLLLLLQLQMWWMIFVTLVGMINSDSDLFHQAADQYKLSPGWQEPGFWRPKFIMERVYINSADGTPTHTDRVYFKLKPDRTMKVYRSNNRPFFEMFKKQSETTEKKKKLFESGDEEIGSMKEQYDAQKSDDTFYDVDGTWWWQDGAPLNQGKVVIETREGKGSSEREKIRHDVRCDWGILDSYVPKFREGKILKYKVEAGIPISTVNVGTFTIKVSPHRPMVSKDFLAFQ